MQYTVYHFIMHDVLVLLFQNETKNMVRSYVNMSLIWILDGEATLPHIFEKWPHFWSIHNLWRSIMAIMVVYWPKMTPYLEESLRWLNPQNCVAPKFHSIFWLDIAIFRLSRYLDLESEESSFLFNATLIFISRNQLIVLKIQTKYKN